jgi:peptidoglycan/xylan/chitin deacetylase (PgdA/CDA1 family)
MRAPLMSCLSVLALVCGPFRAPAAQAGECADPANAIGLARTVEIDANAGPIFGSFTKQAHEPSFLEPKEVVLTFDDGPLPWITKSILDTLDQNCTKATFFSVGKMALAYPAMIKEELARGHTVGSHTYTHPFNLPRMRPEKAHDEIERGVAAVATAAGAPVAPFFRFTGLSDSASLLAYLQTRHMAAFTVDVVSNDSYIGDKQRLIDFTLKEVEQAKGGIILFHDIKSATAKALPEILAALKAQGYRVVHVVPKAPAEPLPQLMTELAPKLAKAPASGERVLLPFYGAIGPEKNSSRLEVTSIAPEAKDRSVQTKPHAAAKSSEGSKSETKSEIRAVAAKASTRTQARASREVDDAAGGTNPPVVVTSEDYANGCITEVRPKPHVNIRRSYR